MLIFLPGGPPQPHPVPHVSHHQFPWVAWVGAVRAYPRGSRGSVQARAQTGCAAGRVPVCCCRVRDGKPSVKQLCNPLDADQGAPLLSPVPADWLGLGTRDRHVAVLAQPAGVSLETEWRCCRARKWGRCWSHNGQAACRGEGGGDFPFDSLKPVAFPWHRVHCHMPREEAGASAPFSPPPPTAAPEMDFLCFWSRVFDRSGKGGRGRSVKGSLVRKSCFWS